MQLDIRSRVTLNDGRKMPWLGLGVYQSPLGQGTQKAVRAAINTGYRLFDTAKIYGNESDVGKAVRESGLPREDLFVTTKLWNSDHGYPTAIRAFEQSLRKLGLDYVDLYLIHWPVPVEREETWKALVRLQQEGRCRSIGVSNFTISHLTQLASDSDVVPAVNQVEFHPFLYQQGLLKYCEENNIQVEAYSPLARGQGLSNERIKEVALRHGKTPAQVMIRWSLQHDAIAIPKSANKDRIIENSRVFDFELSQKEMKDLDSLTHDLRTNWDPTHVP